MPDLSQHNSTRPLPEAAVSLRLWRKARRLLRAAGVLSAGLLMFAVIGSGCSLFERSGRSVSSILGGGGGRVGGLPRIPRMAETVQLEFIFVERPADDPLLSDRQLWEGIDRIGDISPEVRKRLRVNGFRVGHSGSTPNRAIETLLGLTSFSSGTSAPIDSRQLTGRRVIRPNGGETVVQTSRLVPRLRANIITEDGVRTRDFSNARCVLKVKARKLQEGWARLEFVPEIHHGRHGWRPISSNDGWKAGTSQRIHRLYSQRFSMTLNVGDMAVITADNEKPRSLGGRFFLSGDADDRIQRVLFVRLVNVTKGRERRAESGGL